MSAFTEDMLKSMANVERTRAARLNGTVERFKEASMATGYRFRVLQCMTNGQETRLSVTNDGIAPIYRDAYFAIGDTQSKTSLRGLLPGRGLEIVIPTGLTNADDLKIVSPYILPNQQIEFETGTFTALENVTNTRTDIVKQMQNGQIVIIRNNIKYTLLGQSIH